MNKANLVIIIVLILIAAWLIYLNIDKAVTIDHMSTGNEILKKRVELLKNITLDFNKSLNRDQIENILNEKYNDHIVKKETDSLIWVDDIGIKIKDEVLYDIVFM
ncbi:Imm58 family immunity protein [Bacteroidota bacterium]